MGLIHIHLYGLGSWLRRKRERERETRISEFSSILGGKYSLCWWQKSFSASVNNTLEFQEVVTSVRYMLSVLKIRKAGVLFA